MVDSRIRIILFIFILSFFVVISRLFQIQVIGYKRFSQLAKKQFPKVNIWKPRRGNIYDSKGRIVALTVEEGERFIPEGEGLEVFVGFLNWKGEGASGIEYLFNDVLKGEVKKVKWMRDVRGRKILRVNCGDVLKEEGNSIYLTIERPVQYKLYSLIKEALIKYNGNWAAGIVQDVYSGEIIGFSYVDRSNRKKWISNPLITRFFEPGSTLKIIPAAAAIEEGVFSPQDKFWCEEGVFEIFDFPIKDHEKYGWLTFKEII
ncbi:MAG: hypothetical protein DRI36_04560, partial [Caldiserica bacterium]